MPPNLYGPGDDFSLDKSHVIAALMKRFHEAKQRKSDSVKIWGSGKARREFMFIDDLAEAIIRLMNDYESDQFINVGTGEDVSISELAEIIAKVVGYNGKIKYDTSIPDGMPQKLLDTTRYREFDCVKSRSLQSGLVLTYSWFLANASKTLISDEDSS